MIDLSHVILRSKYLYYKIRYLLKMRICKRVQNDGYENDGSDKNPHGFGHGIWGGLPKIS